MPESTADLYKAAVKAKADAMKREEPLRMEEEISNVAKQHDRSNKRKQG